MMDCFAFNFQDIGSCAKFVEGANTTVTAFEKEFKTKLTKVTNYLTEKTGTEITGAADMAAVWEMFYNQVKSFNRPFIGCVDGICIEYDLKNKMNITSSEKTTFCIE